MISVALITIIFTIAHGTQELRCELSWVTSENGAYPENAVAYSLDDVIIRVNLENILYVGRMTPETQIANIVVQNIIIHPTVYEVLANPRNCITEWVSPAFVSDMKNAVTVQDTFIGRTAIISSDHIYIVGGGVVKDLIAVNYGDEIYHEEDFEILVSKYSLQQIHLTDFTFQFIGNQTADKRELIFQQAFISSPNFGVNPIKFESSIWENLELYEENNWIGIGNPITYSITWPHSPRFVGTLDIVLDYNSSVLSGLIARDRNIFSEVPGSFQVNPDIICAYANYNTARVNYTAKAYFEKEDFTEYFFQDSRRKIKFIGGTKVIGEISGFVTGKLYTGTTIISCASCKQTCYELIDLF